MLARLKGDKRGQPAHLPYASSRWSQSAAVRSATATAFCARGARILMSQPRSQLGRAMTSMPLNPHTMSMSSCTRGPGCAVCSRRPSQGTRRRLVQNASLPQAQTKTSAVLGHFFASLLVDTHTHTTVHIINLCIMHLTRCITFWRASR